MGGAVLEQVFLSMPEVIFYFYSDKKQTTDSIEAYLGSTRLHTVYLRRFSEGDNGSGAVVKKGEGSITGMDGTYEGATLPVTGEPVIIGRDTSVCNMIVVGDMVSREHCTVSYNRESHIYMVTDLSSNGTYDGNGKRLANGVPVYMEAGSMIRIGKDGERFILG